MATTCGDEEEAVREVLCYHDVSSHHDPSRLTRGGAMDWGQQPGKFLRFRGTRMLDLDDVSSLSLEGLQVRLFFRGPVSARECVQPCEAYILADAGAVPGHAGAGSGTHWNSSVSAIYWRNAWKYGDPGARYVHQDSQSFHLPAGLLKVPFQNHEGLAARMGSRLSDANARGKPSVALGQAAMPSSAPFDLLPFSRPLVPLLCTVYWASSQGSTFRWEPVQTECGGSSSLPLYELHLVAMFAEYTPLLREAGPWMYSRAHWETGMVGCRGTAMGCFFGPLTQQTFGIDQEQLMDTEHFAIGYAEEDARVQTIPPYAHLRRFRELEDRDAVCIDLEETCRGHCAACGRRAGQFYCDAFELVD
ncbi:unnamed protein product [Polarella glacialis]|uniref:Uncharacterized protein n=1 Tax=Polarella glacialis TaxID=89957 RepID=A0A813LH39_POLGL|nr:unnamed protein product [Polarella glacialis]